MIWGAGMSADPKHLGMPLSLRLRAWWEGYDLDALSLQLSKPEGTQDNLPAELPPLPTRPLARRPRVVARELPRSSASAPTEDGWHEARLTVAQLVWDQGCLGPRDEAGLDTVFGRLKLGPQSRLAHIGAELGGMAQNLRDRLGCLVTAFEMEHSMIAAAPKGSVALVAPDMPPPGGPFDLIIVDGFGDRGERLTDGLRKLLPHLSEQGTLLLRALALGNERAIGTTSYREWIATEPVRMRLRTDSELTRALHEAGYGLRASEDRSLPYVENIERAWAASVDAVRVLHRDTRTRPLVSTLLQEGERWSARVELIRSGALAWRQYAVSRRDRRMSMLSDW